MSKERRSYELVWRCVVVGLVVDRAPYLHRFVYHDVQAFSIVSGWQSLPLLERRAPRSSR